MKFNKSDPEEFLYDGNSLSLFLKNATAEYHEVAETTAIMRKIMSENVSASDYTEMLIRSAAFTSALDSLASRISDYCSDAPAFIPRTPLIEKDLHCLGISERIRNPADHLLSFENSLAALYILEGSALGGAMIASWLEDHLFTECMQYLRVSDLNPPGHWGRITQFLDRESDTGRITLEKAANAAVTLYNFVIDKLSAKFYIQ